MPRIATRIATLGTLALLVACKKSGELDRREAAAVISQTLLRSPVSQVREQPGAFADGIAEGLWDEQGELSSNGSQTISRRANGYLTLVAPLKRTVTQVTGIASPVSAIAVESTNLKEVQFDWSYVEPRGVVKRMIAQGGTGIAVLRKFDDGWRLAEIKTTDNDRPFTLTASDTLQRDSSRNETARLRAEEQNIMDIESEREGEDAGATEADSAKMPSVEIAPFPTLNAVTGRPNSVPLILTDVGYYDVGGGAFFLDMKGKSPRACETPAGHSWKGYCVEFSGGSGRAMFADQQMRDGFLMHVTEALATWRRKYPQFQ